MSANVRARAGTSACARCGAAHPGSSASAPLRWAPIRDVMSHSQDRVPRTPPIAVRPLLPHVLDSSDPSGALIRVNAASRRSTPLSAASLSRCYVACSQGAPINEQPPRPDSRPRDQHPARRLDHRRTAGRHLRGLRRKLSRREPRVSAALDRPDRHARPRDGRRPGRRLQHLARSVDGSPGIRRRPARGAARHALCPARVPASRRQRPPERGTRRRDEV